MGTSPDMADINAARPQNTKSALRQYVAMVVAQQNQPSEPLVNTQIKDKLLVKYASLKEQGNLPSAEYLQKSYKSFQDDFGPEKLKSKEGIELLKFVHDRGNNDSLVFMLEFRFKEFGGIRGGAATKFGIYYKRETEEWITGSATVPRVISEEDAIEYVTKQRDQLLAGVAALTDLPRNASDAEYESLQNRLQDEAPDICNSGWVHKYWHLLFPDKLDDYHNEKWHRHHLIKLLQLPPNAQGLYTCAGRFVQIAKELDWPMNHLTSCIPEHRNE